LNAGVLAGADLPAGTSTTNSENIFLGTKALGTYAADTLAAALIVRGSIETNDLDSLESFLTLFRTGS
jgi:hypothetical protein